MGISTAGPWARSSGNGGNMRSVLLIILGILLTAAPSRALNYVDTALLAGSKNYVKNGGAEQGRAGWTTYADAAGTTMPVDCTGGSPVSTWTTSATTPLSGQYSFVWTHPASNRQGEGFAYTFTIDKADQGKQHTVSFDYEVASGTFTPGVVPIGGATAVDSDVEVFIYDTVNAQIIQPSNFRLLGSGGQQRFAGTFQAASNSTIYRLCGHNATTTTSAFSLRTENFRVSPVLAPYSPIVSDWTSYTPSFTGFGSPTSVNVRWRRVGGNIQVQGSLTTGTTTATPGLIGLPAGLSIDSSMSGGYQAGGYLYQGSVGTQVQSIIATASATSVVVGLQDASHGAINATTNMSAVVGSSVAVSIEFTFPIQGWSSGNPSAQAGDDTRIVGAAYVQDTSSTNTSVAPGATAIIDFNTKTRDDAGLATTGSSWKFTASSPGWYQVNASVKFTGAAAFSAGDQMNVYLYKSGVKGPLMGVFISYGSNSGHNGISGSALTYLNAGDYLDVRLNNNATPTANFDKEGAVSIMKQGGSAQLTATDTVAARYTSTSTANITGTDTQINYDSKDYDTLGMVTTGASWKATAPISGRYRITAGAETSNTSCTSTNSHFTLSLYKNNGSRAEVLDDRICNITGGYRKILRGSADIYLLAGDYIDVRISDGDATTHSLATFATDSATAVEIVRVGN
jgi:hypothetical protein